MRARMFTAQVKPGRWDEAVGIYRSLAPEWLGQRGFKGAYLLGDPDLGTACSITLWETQADLEDSQWSEHLARFAETRVLMPDMVHYDVTVQVQV